MSADAPHSNAESKDYDSRLFLQLAKPSTLSGLVCLLISFFTVVGVVAIMNFQGSGLRQDFLGFQQSVEEDEAAQEEASLSEDYGQLNDNFAQSNLVRNIPVMAFWMFVGVLVYFVVTGIADALASAKEVGDELNYVHARRKELLRAVYVKSAIRLATLGCWLLYIMLFFRVLLPYVLAAAHIGGGNALSLRALPYIVLAFVIMAVTLHIHVVMARLVLLRPRIFSQETSF